jgi:hypothetical protein
MSNSDIRVVVFRPTDDHPTLADEVEDGKVDEAVAAAKLAYAELDADGDIEDFTYAGDLDDVAREIAREAQGTRVLAVVVTDFVSDDQQSAVDAFSGLDDDFVVLVKVSARRRSRHRQQGRRRHRRRPARPRHGVRRGGGLGRRDRLTAAAPATTCGAEAPM